MIIIAGPCAVESEEQVKNSIKEAKKRKVDFLRAPLWKPRTKPGFDGIGEKGLEVFQEIKKEGLVPATEVMTPQHAEIIINAVPDAEVLLWIGARNQNHFLQKEIAYIAAKNKKATLLIKNQPWPNEEHSLGVIEHIKETGIKESNILLCHRGFFPVTKNPKNYRNLPDFEMAARLKQKTGFPMLIDPSHIGGSVSNVFEVIKEVKEYEFDGLMIEVHPTPADALTDKNQQLSWEVFDSLF